MSHESARRPTLDTLKKEAKRWLHALRAGEPEATARLSHAVPDLPGPPTLRLVQLALAREHGFAGWSDLRRAVLPDSRTSARTLAQYEDMVDALLEAYRTGTPEAMAHHYRHTWHRRPWQGMRTYVQLDLGKRPTGPDDEAPITREDGRLLVAHEYGFEDWASLEAFVAGMPGGLALTARPVRIHSADASAAHDRWSRDWRAVLELLRRTPAPGLAAPGVMTDAMLADVARIDTLESLDLSGSPAVTDQGIVQLAGLSNLRALSLNGTAITDGALGVLRHFPRLESLSLSMTRITDAGTRHLAACNELHTVDLMWTHTGDGPIAALAGKPKLRVLLSGNGVTDDGLARLHDLPVFKTWHGGEVSMALLSYDARPNQLLLRGPFTDGGLRRLAGLDGLFGLNLDAAELGISAAGLEPLTTLPNLGWLAVDARDDWMPYVARMPKLRFFGAQDTVAGDAGFVALSASPSIEYLWGRRCHNLRRQGFRALTRMPALRGLSVSCLNVDDEGLASLPDFPALRELMPMDVPDAGYRHIAQCARLDQLVLMYCRGTTDAATEHLPALKHLTYYFNSYTTISDRTPRILSGMDSLERVTFDQCHGLTDDGVATLGRLPRLRELRVAGRGVTPALRSAFRPTVTVSVNG